MDTTNAAKKTKGQWGGRRAGAGRKKGSTSTYMERQEIAGMILGLNDLEHRKKMIRMFREDLTLIQSPAFRFLAPYYFGKVPEPEQQQEPGRGMVIAFLKGRIVEYDPLASRMPKALPSGQPTVIDQKEPELLPDPDAPAPVDIPEQ